MTDRYVEDLGHSRYTTRSTHISGERRRGAVRRGSAVALLGATLMLPFALQADERLQAALAVVEPPDDSDVDRIVASVTADEESAEAKRLRARLRKLYGSPEFRRRAAEVYARHLSDAELRYLAQTFAHPVFRKYRQLAPVLMIELAEIERDLFAKTDALDEGGTEMRQ